MAPRRVRIIAGHWRGRWLAVMDAPGLRPTGSRVRETLFNWLQQAVPGARCVDLFAGTGALGLEAASRGAAEVALVESSPPVAEHLHQQLLALQAGDGPTSASIRVERTTAEAFLQGADPLVDQPVDLVFIDPPFDRWVDGCGWVDALLREVNRVVGDQAWVYLEAPGTSQAGSPSVPADWVLWREQRFGEVMARLYRVRRPGPVNQ